MPVALHNIRELLLPGLWSITNFNMPPDQWNVIFQPETIPAAPISIPVALAVGAAAAIIANPIVTRRWFAWWER